MSFPHIPPRSPGDEPSPEEIALFLEAVARVTSAFVELRDTITPPRNGLFDDGPYDKWFLKWRFNKLPCELADRIKLYCPKLLAWWDFHPQDAELLIVDRGFRKLHAWWAEGKIHYPNVGIPTDRPPRQIEIQSFNMERESFANYRARMIADFEKILRKENDIETERMKLYGARTKQRRKRTLAPEDAYDIFALHHCRGLSDKQIQLWYKRERKRQLKVETIRMARIRLMKDLNLSASDKL